MNNSTLLTRFFSGAIEFGNRYFTLSGLFFRKDKHVFAKMEISMILLTVFCTTILFVIGDLSFALGLFFCILLSQRILEYLIVYSRNFILGRGRVFTHFPDQNSRSQWLIIMFLINLFEVVLTFAVWYAFLSKHFPGSFSAPIGVLDSFYISMVTFFTLGFGDIFPLAGIPKLLISFESFLSFYTFLIIINGLISIHFTGSSNKK